MIMKRALALLGVAVGLAFAAPQALAQNEYEEVVRSQIYDMAAKLASVADDPEIVEYYDGKVDEGDGQQIDLPGSLRGSFVVIAACDQDCTDLDLVLHDSDGNSVTQDVEEDDLPVLQFRASRGEAYHLHVNMHDCSTTTCYYGVAVFQLH